MRRRERDLSALVFSTTTRFVFQQLEKRSWWPDEAGQLRFDSCWKKVQGVRHAPRVSGAAAGARDGAGNKGGPISSRLPTAQRAARPGSPAPTFPARRVRPGQPDEHRPCSPPALLVHDGKSGAKTRVQAFRSTWLGLAECDHGGHKPGASQRVGTSSHVLAEEGAEWERSRKGRPRSHDASRGGVLLLASCWRDSSE
jgi:hypothetical protein